MISPPPSSAFPKFAPNRPPSSRRRPDAGFALLITITLLAFLVLLLVSLASLTRVETQVASNNQTLSQARQNALFALNVAVGQLQNYTGPDQRTTATASLQQPATVAPQWVGAYGNSANNSRTDATVAPATTLLNWLVSGNESTSITLDPASPATNLGRISASTTPRFAPPAAGQLAVDATLPSGYSIKDTANVPVEAIRLVGPATTGNTAGNPAIDPLHVFAPLQPIAVAADQVPGLSGSTATPIGRYAWWVGDEGVKARVNLSDPYPLTGATAAETTSQNRHRYLTPQRVGAEMIDDDTDSANNHPTNGSAFTAAYVANASSINKLESVNQLSLLSTDAAEQAVLKRTQQLRFHDLTTASRGVLSDSRLGGLRRDLTAAFATPSGSLTPELNTFLASPLFTKPTGVTVHASANYNGNGPAWSLLRSFYNLNSTGSSSITPQPYTFTAPGTAQHGVAPVIAGFQVYMGAGTVPVGTDTKFRFFVVPAVVLWNPYNVTITAPSSYFVRLRCSTMPIFLIKNIGGTNKSSSPLPPDGESLASYPAIVGPDVNSALSGSIYAIGDLQLTLASPPNLAPGQAVVFTLPNDFDGSSVTNGGRVQVMTLQPGWANNGLGAYTYDSASFPGTAASGNITMKYGRSSISNYIFDWFAELRRDNITGDRLQVLDGISGNVTTAGGTTGGNTPDNGTTIIGKSPNLFGWKSRLATTDTGNAVLPTGSPLQPMAIRWLANYNPRAPYSNRSPVEAQWLSGTGGGLGRNPSYLSNSANNSTLSAEIRVQLAPEGAPNVPVAYYHPSLPSEAPLFSIPTQSGDLASRFLSLGAFRMANLYYFNPANLPTGPNVYSGNQGVRGGEPSNYSPAYPLGSSLADPRIKADTLFRSLPTSTVNAIGAGNIVAISAPLYDHAYLLNWATWDGYFLSTVSQASAPAFPLPNSRLTGYSLTAAPPTTAELRSFTQASAHLLNEGAFNINSTSVEAWSALLASLRGVSVEGSAFSGVTPVPRHAYDSAPVTISSTDDALDNSTYTGIRTLTDTQIRDLATRIVAEVRARGPFLTLAQFVNRSLVAGDIRGLKGGLQAAIDGTSLNAGMLDPAEAKLPAATPTNLAPSGEPQLYRRILAQGGNPNSLFQDSSNSPGANASSVLSGTDSPVAPYFVNRSAPVGDKQLGFGDTGINTAAQLKDANSAGGQTAAHSAPGFLTQGDLLAALGPALSPRSDTFRIRSYGEVLDPLASTSAAPVVRSRAWCEAIVQRLPDYVESTANAAEVAPVNSVGTLVLTTANATFGRRYKIISFRWLTPEDI